MAFNLRNRNFLKELDFTPDELKFLLKLSADLKAAKYGGYRAAAAEGQEHRPDLRKDLHPHPLRLRGGGLRPGRPRHLPGTVRLADRPQGIDEGHRPRAGAHVRWHRVPRLRPGTGGDPGAVCRRAGVERPDRPVPSHPDAVRHPDHDRSTATSISARSPTATWAMPATTWATR